MEKFRENNYQTCNNVPNINIYNWTAVYIKSLEIIFASKYIFFNLSPPYSFLVRHRMVLQRDNTIEKKIKRRGL